MIPRSATKALLVFVSSLAVALGLGAGPASAHNSFDTSSPSDGEVVTVVPEEWTITFTKDVPLESASAEAIDSTGVRVDLGGALPGPTPEVVRFTLPADLMGTVGLRWRLVSDDGHVISGRVAFTVDPGAATTGAPSAGTDSEMASSSIGGHQTAPEAVRWSIRLLIYAALVLLGGAVFTEFLIAEGTLRSINGRRIIVGAATVLSSGSLLQLLVLLGDVHQVSIFGAVSKLGDAFESTPLAMTAFRFLVGLAVVHGAVLAHRAVDVTRLTRYLFALIGLFSIGLAYTSHSRSRSWPVLGIPIDVLHTLAVATWLGGLLVLLVVVMPLVGDRDALHSFRRFGRAAAVAVPVILVTGTIQTLRLHGDLTTLVSQNHGRLLVVKLLAVSVMLAVANKSRRLNLTRVSAEPSRATHRRRLVRSALTESLIGVLVIAITAALVTADFQ